MRKEEKRRERIEKERGKEKKSQVRGEDWRVKAREVHQQGKRLDCIICEWRGGQCLFPLTQTSTLLFYLWVGDLMMKNESFWIDDVYISHNTWEVQIDLGKIGNL
jgi:hypothetical protein